MNWLRKLLLGKQPATAQYWQGEWDPDPVFYSLWQPPKSGNIQPLPEEYLGLPLPRFEGEEFTFIGSDLPWRGLDVHIDVPNIDPSYLVSEYWDGKRWKRVGQDKTLCNHTTLSRNGQILCCPSERVWDECVIGGQRAFWIRFSVTRDLSPELTGWSDVIHNTPILVTEGWQIRFHKRTACQNRPGLKMQRVTVFDMDGQPLRGIKVGFDTEPSFGIIYDRPDFWGRTDGNGYAEWDSLGIPTCYRLWIDDILVVKNIRVDFPPEYCKPLGSPWWSGNRPINRPGIVSWDLELRKQ